MVDISSYDRLLGTVVGNYRLDRFLERNQSGPNFLASDGANNPYIIRFLESPLANAQASLTSHAQIVYLGLLQQEANRIAALQHAHIQPLFDYGTFRGMFYLVYRQTNSPSVRGLLAQKGPLKMQAVGVYLEQTASALEYAHAQALLHRNLATMNMYIEAGKLIVSEFGLLRLHEIGRQVAKSEAADGPAAKSSLYEGSSEGSAPEQLLGKPIDARTDIYALGAVLYRLLTAHAPFSGKTRDEIARQHLHADVPPLATWRTDVPSALNGVVAKAMAKEPIQRYQLPGELVQAYFTAVGAKRTAAPAIPIAEESPSSEFRASSKIPAIASTQEEARFDKLASSSKIPALPRMDNVAPTKGQPSATKASGATGKVPVASRNEPTEQAIMQQAAPPRRSNIGDTMLAPPRESNVAPVKNQLSSTSRQDGGKASMPMSRRRLILASGGVVAVVAVATIAGIRLSQAATNAPVATNTGNTPQTDTGAQNTPSQGNTPGQTAGGKVLARTTDVALNSAMTFVIANQQNPGLLIHLPDNKFVAFDSTCTHNSCAVNYNPQNHLLECPCHGAVFNPAKGAAVVQGPAPTPLKSININADGTVTQV